MMKRASGFRFALCAAALLAGAVPAWAVPVQEPPFLADKVTAGELPPVAQRLPKSPLVSDMLERGRTPGRYGGDMRTLAAKARDLRYMTALGYARIVGFDEKLDLKPDIVEAVEDDGKGAFTLTLRDGHRWSSGAPFTSEDFRYYWEDIANNKELSPYGPPEIFRVDGQLPIFEVLDERRVRYTWTKPNPRFLPALAQPRPVFIYAPSAYLKQFHASFRDKAELEQLAKKAKLKSWAALHNRLDDP
jgi:peptide/nickel transport system substrate-binding protein